MRKLCREYEARITTPDGQKIKIENPVSVEFDVSRTIDSKQNNATITFYNLSKNTRNAIYKDRFNTLDRWSFQLLSGYRDGPFYEIFRGNIQEAFSEKKGPEWITQVEAYDGAWAIQNGTISETVSAGTDTKGIIERCVNSLPDLITGIIGGDNKTTTRGEVLVGNPYDILVEQTGGKVFIDGETVNVLSGNEVFGGDGFLIDQDQLLGTPKKRETFLEVDTFFSPEIRIGYIARIRSAEERFSGDYRIIGIKHHAVISSAEAGDARTTLSLDYSAAYKDIFK